MALCPLCHFPKHWIFPREKMANRPSIFVVTILKEIQTLYSDFFFSEELQSWGQNASKLNRLEFQKKTVDYILKI